MGHRLESVTTLVSWPVTETTMNVVRAEWLSEPLVPVSVTVKLPAVRLLHDSVDVAEAPRVTLVGLREQLRPLGDEVWVRLTIPAKLLILVTVMVEVPVTPRPTVTVVGLSEMLKSWTTNVVVAQ